ncbi:DNA-binding transcriptional MerR regulator [Rhodoblastus acidophilus]|uniref:MerR family transcriptional regulator n=1 Tax=Rhodoblastus acidophilus TaxID=1074 RepID=UPI0022248E67|nr:MerR family transcriptional regulator [Rhodoblastus acidophilus]MCW2283712.1 DNA-binding transcriptional MerR regulator [Rhodoblastus acidophilus]MCW2332939.1 DNA-binding transcriptional MerR regulator [Rhodoblastus acidophilus]
MKDEDSLRSIGKVADHFKVSSRTLRFYDQIGLVAPIRKSGVRYYSEGQIKKIGDILKYQQAGMSLEQIRTIFEGELGLLREAALNRADIEGMIDRLRVRREEIDDAIQEFESILAA